MESKQCDYCDEENTLIISISELYSSYFKNLYNYYHKSEFGIDYHKDVDDPSIYGDSFYFLIQKDWSIFPETSNNRLFYDIMSFGWDEEIDGELDDNILFSKSSEAITYVDGSHLWQSLSHHLINENRFFPSKELDHFITINDLLEEIRKVLKKYTCKIHKGTVVYRARKGYYTDEKELKAPGNDLVIKGGRTNPAGISMLYCAFTVETAISEVRPYKGEEVTVATLKNSIDLNLVDLSEIQHITSPFQIEDITSEMGSLNLLYVLEECLSRPINPNKSEIEYIPSQYLTEYIKSLGYDGLIFKSSLGKENNLVVFNQSKSVIVKLNHYKISDIEITFR